MLLPMLSVKFSLLCVCLLVASVNPAKMIKPIKTRFGVWTWVDPRNHVLGGCPDLSRRRGNFLGGGNFGGHTMAPKNCLSLNAKTCLQSIFIMFTRGRSSVATSLL